MQRYENSVLYQGQTCLRVAPGAEVYVYEAGTLTAASIYETNDHTPLVNPTKADDQGTFFFYAEDGRYDIRVVAAGRPEQWSRDVLLEDIDALGAVTEDEISVKEGFIDEPAAETPIPSLGQPNGLGDLNAQAKAISANLNFNKQRVDEFENAVDPEKGASLVGYQYSLGASRQSAAGAIRDLRDTAQQFKTPALQATTYSTSVRDDSDWSVVASGEAADRYHHSPNMVRDVQGRLHMVYSRSLMHGYGGLTEANAVDPQGVIIYRYSDDNGKTFSTEQAICTALPPDPVNVIRTVFNCNIGVCPSGRVVIVVADVPPPSSTWGRFTGQTKYRWFISDSRGETGTWVDKGVFFTAFDDYARIYCGSVKRIPAAGGGFRMAFCDYRKITDTPSAAYHIGMWYSDDEFETAPVEGAPIMDADGSNNETDFAFVDAHLALSASRSDIGMRITRDGAASWTKFATQADYDRQISDDFVAPTLDVLWRNGTPHIVMGYTHRGTGPDGLRWVVSTVQDLFNLEAKAAASELFTPWGINYFSGPPVSGPGGYASPVFNDDGELIYLDCTETTVSPNTGYMRSDIRIVRANAAPWFPIKGGLMIGSRVSTLTDYHNNELPWTPRLEGNATPGTPTYSVAAAYGVRDGHEYTFRGQLVVTAFTGMVGTEYLVIKGFPYAFRSLGFQVPVELKILGPLGASITDAHKIVGLMNSGADYITLYKKLNSGSVSPLLVSDLGATFNAVFYGSYICQNEGLS